MKGCRFAAALFVLFLSSPFAFTADPPKRVIPTLPAAVTKSSPESLDDLRAIQDHTKKILEKVVPCTVGVQIGGASGSGVIVTKDGLVLTAGHVSGKPGQKCTIIMPDGKRIEGKSLGRDLRPNSFSSIDSGMFQITTPGEYDFCEMGNSADLKVGQWCIAVGHPNGYVRGRTPVVRLGRIQSKTKSAINTDCTLVGGDSGGPLFDMEGKVIGIHSRIAPSITLNTHVPVDTYRDNWDRLVKSEEIVPGNATITAYFGVQRDDAAKDCKLSRVTEGSPADKGGLKSGDIIVKFDGKEIKSYDDMLGVLSKKKPDEDIEVIVKRADETKTLTVRLGKK
jgi:serine protease Do